MDFDINCILCLVGWIGINCFVMILEIVIFIIKVISIIEILGYFI